MKYRKKPIIIEAIQWTGKNYSEVAEFIIVGYHFINDKLILSTLEGDMIASPGDYIIKGINKEVYPCKPGIFEKTYEPIEDKMNNQIKDVLLAFRVWDKENNCFQQDDADETFIRHNGKLVCVFWGDCDTMSTEYVDQDKSIIERSTGLSDKNGNLIYEGDILKNPFGVQAIVKWHTSTASFQAFKGSDDDLALVWADCEIIGNIHEGIVR